MDDGAADARLVTVTSGVRLAEVMNDACIAAQRRGDVPALPFPYKLEEACRYAAMGAAVALEAAGAWLAAAVVDVRDPVWAEVPAVHVFHLGAVRGAGWGAAMLDRLAAWGAEQGRARLRVLVPPENVTLRAYFERQRFEFRGEAAPVECGARGRVRYERIG